MSKTRTATVLVSSATNRHSRFIDGGLAGVGMATVITSPPLNQADQCLAIALLSFTIAVPLLAASLFVASREEIESYSVYTALMDYIQLAGWISAYVGIVALFFRLSPGLGLLFLLTSVIAAVGVFRVVTRLDDANGIVARTNDSDR
jgi:hypothetical protein